MDPQTDVQLINRIVLNDDHFAFRELVYRYQSNIRGLFLKLTSGDKALADDLAQETFIRVYRYINTFNAAAKFSTWLYRIAYNVFQSWTKKNKRNDLTPQSESNQIEDSENSLFEKVTARIDLMNALKHIKDIEKMVLILSYEKGLTHQEIAGILSLPLGSVKTHILRGKAKLKQYLSIYSE